MDKLRWVLDHTMERRGGQSIASLSKQLIEKLNRIERDDFDIGFLEGLINRLVSGKRYTQYDSNVRYNKRFKNIDRNHLIVYLYDFIYDALADNPDYVEHPILGSHPVPPDKINRSQKTLAVLDTILTNRTVYDPPARSTLHKIIAEASYRKRRPRT